MACYPFCGEQTMTLMKLVNRTSRKGEGTECDEFRYKPSNALRRSSMLTCVEKHPVRTVMTSGFEIQNIPRRGTYGVNSTNP